eukprot:scaffold3906_cov124-Skeletonema_menzelii.AAC.2
MRQYTTAANASLAVFLASGIIHEWLNYSVQVYHHVDVPKESINNPDNVILGSNLAFFAWQFVIISIEQYLGGMSPVKAPQPLVPFTIIMTSLPFAFWFAEPYFQGRFFWDYEGLMPTIIKMV